MTPKKFDLKLPQPSLQIAPLGGLKVYPVYEHELERLAQGSPASLFLNFSLALLSSATSFLIAVLTTEIKSERAFSVFVILTAVFFISGFVLLLLWWSQHSSMRGLLSEIKERMPPTGDPEPTPAGESP